jgi:hypothetical protein
MLRRSAQRSAQHFAGAPRPPTTLDPSFFPYGDSSFADIRGGKQRLFWCDNSRFIFPLVENHAKHQLFLRPPRWGKSLFVDMLHKYLDINEQKNFARLFRGSDIYKRKKELQHKNKYHVMKFDFSVDVTDKDVMSIKKEFDQKVLNAVERFCKRYGLAWRDLTTPSTLGTMERVVNTIVDTKEDARVFLLIDEYDRFANKLMFENPEAYDKVVAGTSGEKFSSPIRSFFESVKALSGVRSFTTGLSPIALADASGANNIGFITQDPRFADMLGFTEKHVEMGLMRLFPRAKVPKVLNVCKRFFNGYRFPYNLEEPASPALYTPQLCLRFFQQCCARPAFSEKVLKRPNELTIADMTDQGSKISSNVVKVLAKNSELRRAFALLQGDGAIRGATVQETFKLNQLTSSPNMDLPVSFMVWHGLLTRGSRNTSRDGTASTSDAADGFVVPNDVVGDPTKDTGIMAEVYAAAERSDVDVLQVVQEPTAERVWRLLTAALTMIETPLDYTISELGLEAIIEQFLRVAGKGHVTVEAERVLRGNGRIDLCLTSASTNKEMLIIELKRVRPSTAKVGAYPSLTWADGSPVKALDVGDAATAQRMLPRLYIHEAAQKWHHERNRLHEVADDAVKQCVAYKDALQAEFPGRTIRWATAIHATVLDGSVPRAPQYTSAFFVSVDGPPEATPLTSTN